MSDDTKLPLTSDNPSEALLAQLREQAPHLFSEGKVDWDKLKATLGEAIETGPERYGLTWAGKSEAFRNVQIPSVGTLLPMPEESVNFDTSENLIIEGDNLEVLKLLQKSYHGKVKMIYIDPPYNTGNEFIYPDNYREGLDEYLRYSGQVSDEGLKQSTNTETSARFHSKWLNMMYPRLFLARNLLREDGFLAVSIDENESRNLRLILDEIFGEENFVGSVVWRKTSGGNDTEFIYVHEQVLLYKRSPQAHLGKMRQNDMHLANFDNPDNDSRGLWSSSDYTSKWSKQERPSLWYPIKNPNTNVDCYPPEGRTWAYSKEETLKNISENRLWWGKSGNNERPRYKRFLADVKEGMPPRSWWDDVGTNEEGFKTFRALGFDKNNFPHPKPIGLIQRLLDICADKDSLVLDFFAGSGTTGQAVLERNTEDGGTRKFVLTQIPEPIDDTILTTIAAVCRERIRRVSSKLKDAEIGNLNLEGKAELDRGFRAFRLSSSNFKIWDANHAAANAQQLAEQLQLYADNVEGQRSQDDILFELILKAGLPLSCKVEQTQVDGKPVYAIANGQLLICLENPISQELLRGMMANEPLQILCLDAAFHGNDPLKTNVVLEAKSRGITFRTV